MNENTNVRFAELPEGNLLHTSTSEVTGRIQSVSSKAHEAPHS